FAEKGAIPRDRDGPAVGRLSGGPDTGGEIHPAIERLRCDHRATPRLYATAYGSLGCRTDVLQRDCLRGLFPYRGNGFSGWYHDRIGYGTCRGDRNRFHGPDSVASVGTAVGDYAFDYGPRYLYSFHACYDDAGHLGGTA